ncbi:hypothetical protein CQA38_07785 [Campylobacter sp. MIT 12-5580]|uniref:OmpP1/FadL family transporter n=1 Tax=Campylobacter sp. MIT 12-5580 TaxID=2040651 RepID=UPI0010F6F53E|nr:outer membrane protein transport protein [Campylobacter sp. MIT 12-5580]TKX28405.1 hypothetical protein CQA38_07785 [Campylobacter sp. MIT 12-5580]
MNKHSKKIYFALSCVLCSNLAFASGYRLAEQSLNGTALNSAFVAGAYGADASYYNPANMAFGKDSDKFEFEFDATFIYVPGFDFTKVGGDIKQDISSIPSTTDPKSVRVQGYANATKQFVPKFFFKSKAYELSEDTKLHYGLSLTTPQGLNMNWDKEGGGFMDDLSLAILDLNPVVSLTYQDFISVGVGASVLYSWGDFDNTLNVPFTSNLVGTMYGTTNVTQTSSAKGWGGGYNLALSIKPTSSTTISTTYRSKRALNMKGNLNALAQMGSLGGFLDIGSTYMDADLKLDADLPAIFNIALAQDFGRIRAEFVYERTFWSSADIFKFGYSNARFYGQTGILGSLEQANPGTTASQMNSADYNAVYYGQGWKDSNAYRLGLSYFGDDHTFMLSFAYDETPTPQGVFGIPDANAFMFGLGLRKRLSESVDVGLAYSLAVKDNRKSFIQSHDGWGELHLVTAGFKYLF